ncbi:MAG TPA: hypothetical protein VGQ46_19675, partial [Thermoanaerobaculia bacterium]|nr:hypothetical protein [Thermoanaerobaculia bacterium]
VKVVNGHSIAGIARGGRQWPRSVDTQSGLAAVGSFGGSPVVLALEDLRVLSDGGPDTHGPNAVAVAGEDVLIGLDSGSVVTVPIASLRLGVGDGARRHDVSNSPILSIAGAPGGWLAGSYSGQVLRVADNPRPALLGSVTLSAPVASLACSPRGDRAAAGTYNGNLVRLGFTDRGLETIADLPLHHGSIKSLAWTTDSSVISGATDGAVRSSDDLGESVELWRHGNLINAVAVDARGFVASASRDRRIQLGRVNGRRVGHLWNLLGPDESIKAVSLIGRGNDLCIVGGSYDFAVYVWRVDLDAEPSADLRSGTVVHEFAQAVSTSCMIDERQMIVASWDGNVALFEIDDERGAPKCRSIVAIRDVVDSAENTQIVMPQ